MNQQQSGTAPLAQVAVPLNTEHPSTTPFRFDGRQVRALTVDGHPVIVGKDACVALGIKNHRDAIARLDPDGVGTADVIDSMGRMQTMRVLHERAIYELIFQSRVPAAARFKAWVTSEVLPEIRRTGGYSAQPAISEDQVIAQALHILDARLKERDAEVAALAPKADAYDQFLDCEGTFSVGTVAKMLGVGPNRLFQMLRDRGIFLEHGPRRNTPRQTYARHFSVKAAIYCKPSGTDGVSYTTHVRPSGVDLIRRLLADDLPDEDTAA